MTLPVSGAISFNNINVELGVSGTTQASLGQSSYRTLAGVPSGAISMSNFYGKSNAFKFTISTNQNKANLRSLAVAAGWNQSSGVEATIASGVYIWSDNINTAALTINGSFPGGVTLINNGYIMGQGGQGGGLDMVNYSANYLLTGGGSAISLGVSCTITNNSYIAGGGGGAGSGGSGYIAMGSSGGGGAGGGAGGCKRESTTSTINGGAGGGIGASGSNGTVLTYMNSLGGGGGRILPGSDTSAPTASSNGGVGVGGIGKGSNVSGGDGSGSGTYSGTQYTGLTVAGYGGSGGGSGGAGTGWPYGGKQNEGGGGGGGWGSSGGRGYNNGAYYTGAAGGNCVSLNGYSVTWSATGTRYGAIA